MEDVFIGSDAVKAGALTRGQLRWNYRALYPDVYIHRRVRPSLFDRTVGAWLWSRRRGVISGQTAAALHGARGVSDDAKVELIYDGRRPPPGIVVHNERVDPDEITEIAELPVTTAARTALDLARHDVRDAAVVRLDALARASGVTAADTATLVDRYRGGRGIRQSLEALSLMDGGALTPRETAVRLTLIDRGLPTPRTDFTVAGTTGNVRVAMGYDAPKVGVAFDMPGLLPQTEWKLIPAGNLPIAAIVYHVRAAVIERGYPLWRLQRLSRH